MAYALLHASTALNRRHVDVVDNLKFHYHFRGLDRIFELAFAAILHLILPDLSRRHAKERIGERGPAYFMGCEFVSRTSALEALLMDRQVEGEGV